MTRDTTSQEFFEQKYRKAADPWEFSSNAYEQSRYTAILNALRHRRYVHAFEPGCSIGVLTSGLARLCDRVDAIDISPTAVERAKVRCKESANVHISCGTLLSVIPDGSLDLVILSEIGYYFVEQELRAMANTLIERIPKSGVLLAAHWLGQSKDHLLSGDRVHEIFRSLEGVHLDHSERNSGFRLDRWIRV